MSTIDYRERRLKRISASILNEPSDAGSANISGNELDKFPTALKCLTKLTHLNADSNQITSLEPLTMLTSLIKCDVCRNCLTQTPQLFSLTTLQQLSLFANRLRTLPDSPLSLKELNVGSNEISELPLQCELTNLTYLDLSQNNLCRVDGLTSLIHLQWVNLEGNRITALPSIGSLSLLEMINITNNRITVLPPSITQLSSLSSFSADNNPLKTLPDGFFKLRTLRFVSLGNTLIDNFKESLEFVSKLQTLLVNNLGITEVPSGISNMTEVHDINISNNNITEIGYLPKATDSLNATNNSINTFSPEGSPQVSNIYLRKNDLDHFPLKLLEMTTLQICDLSQNHISTIPTIPLELKYLKMIDVSFNTLTSIPPIFIHCTRLTKLNASYNKLTTFPPLESLPKLKVLMLSGNSISEIPNELSTLTNLSHLHLANNAFVDFPTILSLLPKIQRLSLALNSLSILPSFCNTSLISLDVSNNRLTSIHFPDSPNLERLKFSHNALASIPNERPSLPKLQWLDLSFNGLVDFRLYFNEFPKLVVLDLSMNNISIPPILHQRPISMRLDGNPDWQSSEYPFLKKFIKPQEYSLESASISCYMKCSNRKEMQDNIISIPNFTAPDNFLFAAIDGHLGCVVANAFSMLFPRILYGFLQTLDVRTAFFQAFEEIQKQLTAMNVTDGAVVTVTYVTPTQIHVAQCGDCRAVYIAGDEAYQLCDEHTPANPLELKRIKEVGGYTERGRVFGDYIVSRSVGDIALKPVISDLPEFVSIKRVKNEQFLIVGSDGLWDQLSNTDITNLLKKKKHCYSVREVATMIADVAFVSGSTDNICLVVCKLN